MIQKKINKTVWLASLAVCFVSCGEPAKKNESHNVIAVEAAYSNPTELKATDCFRKVRYVPLETTDSCLIGSAPSVKILGDRIVVTTARQQQCFLFDKETGRFISTAGHPGDDPQAYSTPAGWLNEEAGRIYFPSATNKQRYVVYNKEGEYVGNLTIPKIGEGFFPLVNFSYLDASTFVGHYAATKEAPDRIMIFRDSTALQTFNTTDERDGLNRTMEDIVSINVSKNSKTGSSFVVVNYKDDGKNVFLVDHNPMWRVGKDIYFKEHFNDTIYQVTPEGLLPSRSFDYGSYRWDRADRYNIEKDQAIFPTTIYENEKVIFFRFVVNLYHQDKQIGYNGIFDKATGEVKVSPYEKGLQDDLTGFLPLQPTTMSGSGEFAAIIPTENIITWFDENAERTDLPAEVAALKKIGEDDNPVVVIME